MLNAPLLKEVWKKSQAYLDHINEEQGLKILNQDYQEVKHEITQMYDDISDCSTRIKNIVKDLKDYAKPGADKSFRQEDMHDIINVSIGLLKNTIKKATYNFELHLNAERHTVHCHKQQMEQTLINLIQNSCQVNS